MVFLDPGWQICVLRVQHVAWSLFLLLSGCSEFSQLGFLEWGELRAPWGFVEKQPTPFVTPKDSGEKQE